MRLVTSLHLSLPLVPPGRLEANHTLEGAGGSITSVDFDPSVSPLSGMGCPPPSVSIARQVGALGPEGTHGHPRTQPLGSYTNPPPWPQGLLGLPRGPGL